MKKAGVYVILVFGLFLLVNITQAFARTATVTLIAVDESGAPLAGVDVGVGFEKNTGWSTDTKAQRGKTGADGRFTASGSCNGHIGYGGRKDGYYRSQYEYDFGKVNRSDQKTWNPELKIVMRKIGNPVPMYARNAGMAREISFPVLDKDIGFDLIACDWVAPYGGGSTADFVFNLKKSYSSSKIFSSELTVAFSNKEDGIVNVQEDLESGSLFKMPRYAPMSGYQNSINLYQERSDGNISKSYNNQDSYVFRVRSSNNSAGEITAMYGKLRGSIVVSGVWQEQPIITFKYYLNPDGTRNLEFDPKKNLFGKLPMLEQVNEP